MQSLSLPPARSLTSFRSGSCPPFNSRLSTVFSSSNSPCALADLETTTRHDDLRLLQPPLQLVLLSNDARFCSLMRSFLQHAGFAVFTCTTSDRAESLFLNRSDLQLWIIDVQALGIEAVYFATRVREQHPSMPILLILGEQRDHRSLRQFLLHGWTQLTKPIDLSKMLTTINEVLANAPHHPVAGHFKSRSSDAPFEPYEPDGFDDFRWTNLGRLRN